MSEFDILIGQFEAEQRQQLATLIARLRAAIRPSVSATTSAIVTISVGEAAYLSGLSESQVRKLCEANPFGQPGGFGFKRGGRWEVIEESFLASRNLGTRVSRV